MWAISVTIINTIVISKSLIPWFFLIPKVQDGFYPSPRNITITTKQPKRFTVTITYKSTCKRTFLKPSVAKPARRIGKLYPSYNLIIIFNLFWKKNRTFLSHFLKQQTPSVHKNTKFEGNYRVCLPNRTLGSLHPHPITKRWKRIFENVYTMHYCVCKFEMTWLSLGQAGVVTAMNYRTRARTRLLSRWVANTPMAPNIRRTVYTKRCNDLK